ncbi:hypothetical protein PR048_011684 [Dryococelus australis]|uniref:C2H2-type domain-containing protein n=1 Tax=Dryococelus australis TaxID=614101 RepID=A0ABQ9HN11_9NEOP|nr:hypothetical protein PR048_011684 [Dryococelus australis]
MQALGFQCRWCDHSFSSKSRCAVHEQKDHEADFNAAIPGPAKGHTLWTLKELCILVQQEFYLPPSTRNFSPVQVAEVHQKGLYLDLKFESTKSQCKCASLARGAELCQEMSQTTSGLDPQEIIEEYLDDPHGMACTISLEEVQSADISGQRAPGPDGVPVQIWKKVPSGSKWLLQVRAVLIPKNEVPQSPADFRPISIASIILRQYHKILAQRIQVGMAIAPEQSVFLNSDGLAKNLSFMSQSLSLATSQLRYVYAAVLDIKKAFDTVQYVPLLNILRSHGAPYQLVRYIHKIYALDTMSIQLPGDLVLVASSHSGLQSNLDTLVRGLATVGLDISPEKSHLLSLVAVGKTRKIKFPTEGTFKLGDKYPTPLGITECWKYSGISFTARDVKAFRKEIEEPLRWIYEAPLKKFQRMEIVRIFLIRSSTPVWILTCLRNVSKSEYPPARSLVECPCFSRKAEWDERVAVVDGNFLDSNLKVKNFWKAKLLDSVDERDSFSCEDDSG